MEKKEIFEIIDFMKILYPNAKKLNKDESTIEAWFMFLEDYSQDDVKRVIKEIYKQMKYLPTIQEIVEKLENSFKVKTHENRSGITIFVDYSNSKFPFSFSRKEDAKELILFLKTNPSKEDVEYFYNEHIRTRNNHAAALYVDQSQRNEFDNRKRNDYYTRRMNDAR